MGAAVPDKVEFYRHSVGNAEREAVTEAMEGAFLTTGAITHAFESELASYLGGEVHALGTNSCTAALHLALIGLGIGEGDEVITTPLTFIATANAILHAGATPVFADVEADTGLIDLGQVERAITPRTRAVIPVHLYGQMVDVAALQSLCKPRGIKVIEDAAHAVEPRRNGVQPGQLGDAACFSFYGTKNITSGEGGALVSRDERLIERMRMLGTHGMSKNAAGRYGGSYEHWDMLELGYKYNLSNLQAAMLRPQLARIESLWSQRAAVVTGYSEALCDLPGLTLPRQLGGEDTRSAHHLQVIWVRGRRDELLAGYGEQGIGVAVNYRAIHRLTYYAQRLGLQPGSYPVAEDLGERCISLPLYPSLTHAEQQRVIEVTSQLHERLLN